MIKKIIFSTMLLFLMASTAYAYTDVASTRSDYEAIHRLSDMGIISGYNDGTFRPDSTITRAEFSSLMVNALGKSTEAKSMGNTLFFGDVPSSLWSAPYVNYVSSKGIVTGYPDGNFQPNKTVSFAESLTILLRVLDYKEDTVGYYWPDNYVDAGRSLGISDGLYYQNDQPITRGSAAVMIDRSIFTDICKKEDSLILENAGYKIIRDVVVLSSGREVKLSDSNTYTSKMSLDVKTGTFADYAVLDKNSRLVAVKSTGTGADVSRYSLSVYVNAVTDNTVSYLSNGVYGSYRLDSNFIIYNDGQKQTFAQAKSAVTAGCDLTFYGENEGVWDFAVVTADGVAPVIASHNYAESSATLEGTIINHLGLTVYRDGKSATLSDIAVNDVVYYNTLSNVMDCYSKKVTGIYYEALPSKSAVEKVTIGGKSYEIGSDSAAHMLGANASSFDIGDRVTLLLGKNDKAVFAVELEGTTIDEYGVVLSSGTRLSEDGETEIYAEIFSTSGEAREIITKTDYKNLIGSLVKIDYTNEKATLTECGTNSSYVGTLDTKNRTLNGKDILKSAVVIQRVGYNKGSSAQCVKLDLGTMTAKTVSAKQLLGVVVSGSFGDVMVLYVENVESTASFGIVTKAEDRKYTIYSNGTEKTYNTSFSVANLGRNTPVLFNLTGSDSDILQKLYKTASGRVEACDGSRIKIGTKVYDIAPDVQVIDISDNDAVSVGIDRITDGVYKSASIYSDTSQSSGGLIRIITVE